MQDFCGCLNKGFPYLFLSLSCRSILRVIEKFQQRSECMCGDHVHKRSTWEVQEGVRRKVHFRHSVFGELMYKGPVGIG